MNSKGYKVSNKYCNVPWAVHTEQPNWSTRHITRCDELSSGWVWLHRPTFFIQQHHDAVSMGVAIEVACDDMAVLSKDGHQPLVVVLSNSSDVSGKRQVSNRHMCYDENL